MLTQSLTKHISGMIFLLVLLTACDGGGGINFNIDGNNWPWPWEKNADFFASKTFQQDVMVIDNMSLHLDGINGEVHITGQPDASSVRITAEARVGAESFNEAQTGLNQLEVNIMDINGEISIQTVQPNNASGRQYIVNYTLSIPTDLAVSVSLANGHITVTDMEKSIFVVLGNGDVNLAGIDGDTSVNVENGDISGSMYLSAQSEIVISTVNGNIDLSIPTSASAELFLLVDNGIINWGNLDLINVQYTNQSLQGILGQGLGVIDLETVNGNIELMGIDI
jgi:hypothetical protein